MGIVALLLYVLLAVLMGVVLYYGWKLLKSAVEIFTEILVMSKIFTGESSYHETKRPLRLYVYTCRTRYLDEVTINELYNFLFASGMVEYEGGGKDAEMAYFHNALLNYSHIVLFREKIDGSLRGMATFAIKHLEKHTELLLGWGFYRNHYKGGPYNLITLGYFILKELIFHPLTPIYVVGRIISYHSYMFAMKFKEAYPRHDRETPELFKKILNDFAQSEMTEGDTYNEETNVLIQERVHLTGSLTGVSEKDLLNPHIKFYVERNPGYTKGHTLFVVWKMGWRDLITVATETFTKSFRRSKLKQSGVGRTPEKRYRPPLEKRFTFQEPAANAYAVNLYQADMGGECILSPVRRGSFVFGPLSPTKSSNGSPLKSPTSALPDFTL